MGTERGAILWPGGRNDGAGEGKGFCELEKLLKGDEEFESG